MRPRPGPRPRVSAIVVTYRSADRLPRLLPALAAAVDELVVVDNASDDGSAEVAARLAPGAVVVRNERNAGFAAGVNAGAALATGDLLLLCNPDVTLGEGAVAALVDASGRHPGDVVGPVVRLPGGRFQPTRCGEPTLWNLLGEQVLVPESATPGRWPSRMWPRWRGYDREEPAPLLSGACLLIPRDLWLRTGEMDERYFLYWEEIDWQLRAQRHGARSVLVPAAEVVHERAASTGRFDPARAGLFAATTRRFVRSWLPGWRGSVALALLAAGQLARALAWSLPGPRSRPAALARRAQHRAMLRGLLQPEAGTEPEAGRGTHGAAVEAGSGTAAPPGGGRRAGRVWVVEEFGRGGIARYAADVAGLLAPETDTVVATTSGGPAPGLRAPHTVWFATGGGGTLAKARAGATALVLLPRRITRGDVAWIALGVRPAYELALAAALRASGARVIATLHNRAPHGRRRPSRLVLAAARRAHAVVVHSEAVAAWARQRGLPVHVLPFPPPEEDAGGPAGRHDRESLGAGPGDVLVALAGNLYPYKGVDVLLDAAARAANPGDADRLRYVLAGQPARGLDLDAEVALRGLDGRVRVVAGYLPPGELVDVLTAADAIALPYRRIDHSGVGALAASRGLPAVASDLPPLRELFGDAATYVPPGDPAALAAALMDLPGRLPDLRRAAAARGPAPQPGAAYRCLVGAVTAGRTSPGRR